MAEIILEPTVQSKVIPLSLRLNDTDTSLVSQLVTNRQFNTADTDAWFGFTLEGLAATTGTFDLTLINLQDKSVFNHTDKVFNTNPFYYKLDSGTDELTNEIRHAGKWVGQLVVTLANGDSATRKFIFGIEGHILDGTVVQTILLEDYNTLIASIESAKDELTQYNIDYASLIGTVTEQEAARLEAEELRVIADALRETKEGIRQATFEANEVIRDGVVDSAIEGEMISQTVATKLTEKEATFAPRMLSLESELADNESVVGIKKGTDFGWEMGTINSSTGVNVSSTSRIRTSGYIPINPKIKIEITNLDYSFYLAQYDENSNYISASDYVTIIENVNSDAVLGRLVLKKNSGALFTLNELASVPVHLDIYANPKISDTLLALESSSKMKLEKAEFNSFNFDKTVTADVAYWEYGAINNTTGVNLKKSLNRIRFRSLFKVEKDTKIILKDISSYSYYLVMYNEEETFFSGTEYTNEPILIPCDGYMRLVLKKIDDSVFSAEEFANAPKSLDIVFEKISEAATRHRVTVGSIGQIGAGITNGDDSEYTLTAIKYLHTRSILSGSAATETPHLPVGYLYHSTPYSAANKLYYSANRADRPEHIGDLDFDPYHYQSAIGEDGEIIWVNDGDRTTKPRVHTSDSYNTSNTIQTDVTPIAWLQNNGIDFAKDSLGNEYCIFGEYTGNIVSEVHLWKVTKPYTDPLNWRRVMTQTQIPHTSTESNGVWHFHTVNYDSYTGVWYATSGDQEQLCKWWYSTDEGETWTLFVQGDTIGWEEQIARLVGFAFTKDYVYWGNDYGTNHSLNRVSRDVNGIIDPATRVKLAELIKNQSTYTTAVLHSPPGILMYDRVDAYFAGNTDELTLDFWSFEDEKIHTLTTFKRDPSKVNTVFGFRCKTYSLYQGIYDTKMMVGFGVYPNWLDMPYNENERRVSVTLDVY